MCSLAARGELVCECERISLGCLPLTIQQRMHSCIHTQYTLLCFDHDLQRHRCANELKRVRVASVA